MKFSWLILRCLWIHLFEQGYSRLTEAEPDIIAGGTRSQWEERGGGKYGCWGKVSAYKLNGWEYYATKFHSRTFIKASVL